MILKHTVILLFFMSIGLYAVDTEPDLASIKTFFENKVSNWHSNEVRFRCSRTLKNPELTSIALTSCMRGQFDQFFEDVGHDAQRFTLLCALYTKMDKGFLFSLTRKQRKSLKNWPEPIRLIVNLYIKEQSSCTIV